jgi:hypothetical protein
MMNEEATELTPRREERGEAQRIFNLAFSANLCALCVSAFGLISAI